MRRSRIRWSNVGRMAAGLVAAGLLIALAPGLLEPREPEPLPADLGLATSATGRYVQAARNPTAARPVREPAERRGLARERARPRHGGGQPDARSSAGGQPDAVSSREREPATPPAQQPVQPPPPTPAPVAAAAPAPATAPAPDPPPRDPPPSEPPTPHPPAELEPLEPPPDRDPPPDQPAPGPSQFGFEQ